MEFVTAKEMKKFGKRKYFYIPLWLNFVIVLVSIGVIALMMFWQQKEIETYEPSIYSVGYPSEGADVFIIFLILATAFWLLIVLLHAGANIFCKERHYIQIDKWL